MNIFGITRDQKTTLKVAGETETQLQRESHPQHGPVVGREITKGLEHRFTCPGVQKKKKKP